MPPIRTYTLLPKALRPPVFFPFALIFRSFLEDAALLGEELTRIVAAGTGVDEHLDPDAFRAIGETLARHLNDGLAAAIREGFRHRGR